MLAACGDLGITIDYHLLALLWVATGVADRNSLSFMGTHLKIPRCPTTMLPQCLWEFQNGTWAGPPISVSQYVMKEPTLQWQCKELLATPEDSPLCHRLKVFFHGGLARTQPGWLLTSFLNPCFHVGNLKRYLKPTMKILLLSNTYVALHLYYLLVIITKAL